MKTAPLTQPVTTAQPPRRSGVNPRERRYINEAWETYAALYRQAQHTLSDADFQALRDKLMGLANLYPNNWAQVSEAIALCRAALK